ncbi:MAG: ABC transporter ATP-binding protein [Clostridiales bacterium]|nr:ABC transporter ATP-binding protein [Clostridiales bacterium]
MDKAYLSINGLVKRFDRLSVIEDFTLQIGKGEFVCVVGPTGCGKTTLLRSLMGLTPIDAGQILLNGKPLSLSESSVGYISQEDTLMPWLNALDNAAFGMKVRGVPRRERVRAAADAFEKLGLNDISKRFPREISASQQKQVTLARALCVKPEILLMDEPYSQIDSSSRHKLWNELLTLKAQTGVTVLFITHNVEEAVYLADRIIVLSDKPIKIKQDIRVTIPYPRNIADEKFIQLREHVTEQIKWW